MSRERLKHRLDREWMSGKADSSSPYLGASTRDIDHLESCMEALFYVAGRIEAGGDPAIAETKSVLGYLQAETGLDGAAAEALERFGAALVDSACELREALVADSDELDDPSRGIVSGDTFVEVEF